MSNNRHSDRFQLINFSVYSTSLPNIKFSENPFKGCRVRKLIQTEGRTGWMMSTGAPHGQENVRLVTYVQILSRCENH